MNIKNSDLSERLEFAKQLAVNAGELALKRFTAHEKLQVSIKSHQDFVSDADLEVETLIREKIALTFSDDGIIGEEHAEKTGTSGYQWVIDPIDGTFNFINSIPAWCVVLTLVADDEVKIGVIYEPCHNELFWSLKGKGAYLNDQLLSTATTNGLNDGSTGVGMNGRTSVKQVTDYLCVLVNRGGIFYRNASGALMLAYVASGRLIGYVESHMNAWDCMAGQLLVAEAGGKIEPQSAQIMLEKGGRVIASTQSVFDEYVSIADECFPPAV